MELKTQYSIGDTVYAAEVRWTEQASPCPDCLGTRSWKAITPAGEEIAIECPACKCGYLVTGQIKEWNFYGATKSYTIGAVRFDSQDGVEYMCHETGVGSGQNWKEHELHATREQAEEALPEKVEAARVFREERDAKEYARRRGDTPGAMAAYYRKEIRDGKRKIEEAEKQLERMKGEPELATA